VLYPVFIHTFLNLLERGGAGEAAQFMGRHKRRFCEAAAHPSRTRKQVQLRSQRVWGAACPISAPAAARCVQLLLPALPWDASCACAMLAA
jgi:hypothetical protein